MRVLPPIAVGFGVVALVALGCGEQADDSGAGRPANESADIERFCEITREIGLATKRAFGRAARRESNPSSKRNLDASARRVRRQNAARYEAAYELAPAELQDALRKAERAETPEEVLATQGPIQAFLRENCLRDQDG